MEIKVNNSPVTVKTIQIDGKKISKQFLNQIPTNYFVYHLNEKDERCYGVKKIFEDEDDESEDFGVTHLERNYHVDGDILGWINIELDNFFNIRRWAGITNKQMNNYRGSFTLVIYVNSNGTLLKSYVDRISDLVIEKEYDQIYI